MEMRTDCVRGCNKKRRKIKANDMVIIWTLFLSFQLFFPSSVADKVVGSVPDCDQGIHTFTRALCSALRPLLSRSVGPLHLGSESVPSCR